jgi:predicted nucleic acid-binding protein
VSRFVLDCSVTMSWCFESEADVYTRAVLSALPRGLAVVPPLWLGEVANVLLVAERRRRITSGDSRRFVALLAELPIMVAGPGSVTDIEPLTLLGRELGLSAYDAVYVRLARRERLPLATRDRGLRKAAATVGISLFDPRS